MDIARIMMLFKETGFFPYHLLEGRPLQTGQRIAFRGKSWVSRTISGQMLKYAHKKGIEVEYDWVPSHWATLTICEDVCLVHGSIESGFKPQPLEDCVDDTTDFIILETKSPYTLAQKQEVVKYTARLSKKSIVYAYWELILWWLLVNFNIDWFPKKWMEWALVCYSSTKMILEKVSPGGIEFNPNKVDAFQVRRPDDRVVWDHRVF